MPCSDDVDAGTVHRAHANWIGTDERTHIVIRSETKDERDEDDHWHMEHRCKAVGCGVRAQFVRETTVFAP